MAEKLNLPKQVIKSNWKDDIDVDYAIYSNSEKEEAKYIPPSETAMDPNSIVKIKKFQEKLAFNGLKRFRKEQKLAA